jgi:putative Ca2+/H+ antiporter (TMEM165/GDT1 family)
MSENNCTVDAFWLSYAVIFVAELGDKSQLMAMTFATQYRFWAVILAITAATAVVHLFSVGLVLGGAGSRWGWEIWSGWLGTWV